MTEEAQIAKKVVQKWEQVALSRGKDFGLQVIAEANKAGLPPEALQYLFWVLVEKTSLWGLGGVQRRALVLARDLMVRSDRVPAYHKGFQQIPPELESSVDRAILKLSLWAQGILVLLLKKDIFRAANGELAQLAQVLEKHDLKGKTLTYLVEYLKDTTRNQPGWFKHPDLMQPLLSSVLG